jgi:Ca2+-binding RTX toxin-like protein
VTRGPSGERLLVAEQVDAVEDGHGSPFSYRRQDDVFFTRGGGDFVLGGSGNDTLRGEAGKNTLIGESGRDFCFGGDDNDLLDGGPGDDTLAGDRGNDKLNGGLGPDILRGGTGSDTFDYNFLADSGTGVGNRDIIADFFRGADKIDLSSIDANPGVAGNQAFNFIGTSGFTAPGQVAISISPDTGGLRVLLNTDADTQSEMQIELTGQTTLSLNDLFL